MVIFGRLIGFADKKNFMPLALHVEDYMLPCFTKKIFGVDCPGCGMQRAASFLVQGDFSAAFEMYPAIFAIIPLLIILLADVFLDIKYANLIITTLATVSVALILINYITKFI